MQRTAASGDVPRLRVSRRPARLGPLLVRRGWPGPYSKLRSPAVGVSDLRRAPVKQQYELARPLVGRHGHLVGVRLHRGEPRVCHVTTHFRERSLPAQSFRATARTKPSRMQQSGSRSSRSGAAARSFQARTSSAGRPYRSERLANNRNRPPMPSRVSAERGPSALSGTSSAEIRAVLLRATAPESPARRTCPAHPGLGSSACERT